ncbi:MAG: secondary thiamine-phosphate synthase enzyme YjbQ [Spirochaetaceae bacterium]|jgi:secondary thiamine-phosphate synthase enzyme|nr:secondary thiamine-phosphate synthase enzyme YjbQ [Spirochaetaceae bacterium]
MTPSGTAIARLPSGGLSILRDFRYTIGMTALSTFTIQTHLPNEWRNITAEVRKTVADSGVREGICVVFVPHTTAAVTINENADPDVPRDMLAAMNAISPDRAEFRHAEGNSAAHMKTSLVGPSVTIIVSAGQPLLGTWQGVWFTEFDGPRTRTVHVRVLGE